MQSAIFRRRPKSFRCRSSRTRLTSSRATSKGRTSISARTSWSPTILIPAASDTLQVLTYRNPVSGQPSPTETAPVRSTNEPGFFEAEALLGLGAASLTAEWPRAALPRRSSSCSIPRFPCNGRSWSAAIRPWKLCCAPCAQPTTSAWCSSILKLRSLPLSSAEGRSIQHAMEFVRASRLRGGTDIQHALQAGLQQAAVSRRGQPLSCDSERRRRNSRAHPQRQTGGMVRDRVEAAPGNPAPAHLHFRRRRRCQPAAVSYARPPGRLARTRAIDRADGVQAELVSLEDRSQPHRTARACGRAGSAVDTVYPLQAATFSGSLASWVGRYQKPQEKVSFTVHGVRDGTARAR